LLIVHCAYHRAGTVWFWKVFQDVVGRYGLTFEYGNRDTSLQSGTDMAMYVHSWQFDRTRLGRSSFTGTHIVRDPRDLVVSSYRYHLKTREAWALRPNRRYGGSSYQEYLNSIDQHDGLMVEMGRWSKQPRGPFFKMSTWDYNQPEFLELRYEDVIVDEDAAFEKIFDHYGFTESARNQVVAMARVHSLANIDKWKEGSDHVSSGATNQWRDFFDSEHRARFKEVAGDLLVQLGYETGYDW
jgi:hypothetical protein